MIIDTTQNGVALMIDPKAIDLFTGKLKGILDEELRAGNRIEDTWYDWPSPHTVAVVLSRPFLTPIKKDLPGIIFQDLNDPHYWKANYFDTERKLYLICGFSGPSDLSIRF